MEYGLKCTTAPGTLDRFWRWDNVWRQCLGVGVGGHLLLASGGSRPGILLKICSEQEIISTKTHSARASKCQGKETKGYLLTFSMFRLLVFFISFSYILFNWFSLWSLLLFLFCVLEKDVLYNAWTQYLFWLFHVKNIPST